MVTFQVHDSHMWLMATVLTAQIERFHHYRNFYWMALF